MKSKYSAKQIAGASRAITNQCGAMPQSVFNHLLRLVLERGNSKLEDSLIAAVRSGKGVIVSVYTDESTKIDKAIMNAELKN